jgi:methyltransferase (TIGR00027 family)
MEADRPSHTASLVATARGLGVLLPREGQLIDDPWGATWTGNARLRGLGERLPSIAKRLLAPGWGWLLYMQVRSYALDELVRGFAATGGRALVLLGAGLDARALRLGALGLDVFEVDHPATQARKRRLAGGAARFVPWDFERAPLEALPAALGAAGFAVGGRACVIWEGVSMYLTPPAIESTFAMLRTLLGAGSRLGFTYFTEERVAHPPLGMRWLGRAIARGGEPWQYGWDPGALPGWLRERGFELDEDEETKRYAERWLPPALARRIGHEGHRIALATRLGKAT